MLFKDLQAIDSQIIHALPFKEMTPVQERVIPELLKRDVIVQSQTGTGKTLSYLIPIMNNIMSSNNKRDNKDSNKTNNLNNNSNIHALIIVPTRELAIQIHNTLSIFPVTSCISIGGTQEDININTQILIGTPGRLHEIIPQIKPKLTKMKYLILDEADKFSNIEFENKIRNIIGFLPKDRITGLFSATINDEIIKMCFMHNALKIRMTEGLPEGLQLRYFLGNPIEKYEELRKMVKGRKSLVFLSTCLQVDLFYSVITYNSKCANQRDDNSKCDDNDNATTAVLKIHGKMNQKDRNEVYSKFERMKHGLLLCTDVSARGIDFKDVERVIHFDIPKEYSNIVHRSGRTARMGKEGLSVIFLMPNEKSYVEFLKLKGIEISPIDNKLGDDMNDSDMNDSNMNNTIVDHSKVDHNMNDPIPHLSEWNSHIKQNKDLLNLSVKAFVSYIRAYKEHILNYILNYKELDFDGLAELHSLERIPSMKELRQVKFKEYSRKL